MSQEKLLSELAGLRRELASLKQEKTDLEILLDIAVAHSDCLEAELQDEAEEAVQEKNDLALLLETTTEHSDMVTAELEDQAREAAQESERRLAQFLEAVPVGVAVLDAVGTPYYANRKAQHLLGSGFTSKQPLEQFGAIYQGYIAGTRRLYPYEKLPLVQALRGKSVNISNIELERGNKIIPLEIWATPIFNQKGTIVYALAAFQDISQRKEAEAERLRLLQEKKAKEVALRMNVQLQEEISNRLRAESALRKANKTLQRLATLDGLTQIANRRSLDGYLKQEWHRLAREQAPLSCIMCDIDYFKNYNDAYGHQAGDDCLKLVAQTISQTVMRPADLAARYGGEEFAVILPGANAESAMLVARSIWQGVNRLGIPHARSLSEDRVTLSLGVASMIPKSDSSSEVLMVMADKALYTAKKQGRNQVVLNAMQAVPRRLPAKP